MGDRAVQRSLHRFGVTAVSKSSSVRGNNQEARGAGESSDGARPKSVLFNLLTGGGGHVSGSSSKETRRKKRHEGGKEAREESGVEDDDDDAAKRRKRQTTTTTKTTTTTAAAAATTTSPSLLAPCPVCGVLFRRGTELDAHVASEVASGLFDEEKEKERLACPPSRSSSSIVAVVAPRPPTLFLQNPKRKQKSVFELSEATAASSRAPALKQSIISSTVSLEEASARLEKENRRRRQGRVLRLPGKFDAASRFNHYADGGGNWGDETLGIDGTSGATAWQARGVSSIGDPFRGGARGGDVGGD